jgi:uncharacterized cupin superfamily protein
VDAIISSWAEIRPNKEIGEAFMRNMIAAALSLSLAATTAMAGTNIVPLAPGKPAGVKHAQVDTTALVVILGIAGTITAIALATASSGNPGGPVALTTVPSTGTG